MQISLAPVAPPTHVPTERIVDFDIYNLPPAADLHAAWKTLQRPEVPDIVWTPRNGGHWILTRGEWVNKAYLDHESFKSRIILVPKSVGEQYNFIPNTVDPPEHRPYRALLNSSLSPKAILALEPQIAGLAEKLLDAIVPHGHCDFTAEFAAVLPVQIFLTMCDLPVSDGPMLKKWADQFTRPDGSMTMAQAIGHFHDYLLAPVRERRASPRNDMLSRLVNGQIGDRSLSEEEALALTSQVLLGGLDTVVNFLSFAMLFLARNPEHRRQLIEDPELLRPAIVELLRRFPLATSARVVEHDMTFAGVDLKEGDMVVVPSALHGLDDRENSDPMNVDFRRARGSHSTFGAGPHHCPGSTLARAEIRITLETWLRRIPEFEVAKSAKISYRSGVVASVEALPLVWDRGNLT